VGRARVAQRPVHVTVPVAVEGVDTVADRQLAQSLGCELVEEICIATPMDPAVFVCPTQVWTALSPRVVWPSDGTGSEEWRVALQQLFVASRALLGGHLGRVAALVAETPQGLEDLRAPLFAGTGVLVGLAHRPSVRAVVVGEQGRHLNVRVADRRVGGASSGIPLRSPLHAALHAGV
jgi:hypothetical protein